MNSSLPGPQQNRRHWEKTLDAQNLGSAPRTDDRRQLRLAATADVRRALSHIGPLHGRVVLDLGGGLGFIAIMLARRGATVIVADISLPRLREACQRAKHFRVTERIHFIVAAGENLPLQTNSLDSALSKSVVIHCDLIKTGTELSRCLAPHGRACFIEPTIYNPFVRVYRATLAPREWKSITRYFDRGLERVFAHCFAGKFQIRMERLYVVAFLATLFNYAIPWPNQYEWAEKNLLRIDRLLTRFLPFLPHFSWFTLFLIRGRRDE